MLVRLKRPLCVTGSLPVVVGDGVGSNVLEPVTSSEKVLEYDFVLVFVISSDGVPVKE